MKLGVRRPIFHIAYKANFKPWSPNDDVRDAHAHHTQLANGRFGHGHHRVFLDCLSRPSPRRIRPVSRLTRSCSNRTPWPWRSTLLTGRQNIVGRWRDRCAADRARSGAGRPSPYLQCLCRPKRQPSTPDDAPRFEWLFSMLPSLTASPPTAGSTHSSSHHNITTSVRSFTRTTSGHLERPPAPPFVPVSSLPLPPHPRPNPRGAVSYTHLTLPTKRIV